MALVWKTDKHIPKDCIECRDEIGPAVAGCRAFCEVYRKAYLEMKIGFDESSNAYKAEKSVEELIEEQGRPDDCPIIGEISDDFIEDLLRECRKPPKTAVDAVREAQLTQARIEACGEYLSRHIPLAEDRLIWGAFRLKPCPKCGSFNLTTVEIKPGYGAIVCDNCKFEYPDGAGGMDMLPPAELVGKWNRLARKM